MTQTPCRAGKQPAGPQIACSKTTMEKISYTRREIEQLVVMQRLAISGILNSKNSIESVK
jgi:hypothetical protein